MNPWSFNLGLLREEAVQWGSGEFGNCILFGEERRIGGTAVVCDCHGQKSSRECSSAGSFAQCHAACATGLRPCPSPCFTGLFQTHTLCRVLVGVLLLPLVLFRVVLQSTWTSASGFHSKFSESLFFVCLFNVILTIILQAQSAKPWVCFAFIFNKTNGDFASECRWEWWLWARQSQCRWFRKSMMADIAILEKTKCKNSSKKHPRSLPNLFPNPLFFHGSVGQTPNLSSIFFLAMDHHHHQELLFAFTLILGAWEKWWCFQQ